MAKKQEQEQDTTKRGFDLAKLLGDWLSPQGLIVILGFIIWLVQLNIGYSQLKEDSGELRASFSHLAEMVEKQMVHLERVAVLLDNTASTVAKVNRDCEAHRAQSAHPVASEKIRRLEREHEHERRPEE